MGGALLAWCMAQGTAAWAQYLPVGPAPQPVADPIPMAPSNKSPAVPGPMPAWMAPRGPSPDLCLPGDLPGAFPCDDDCVPEFCGLYIGGGALALDRGNLGKMPLAMHSVFNPAAYNSPEAMNADQLSTSLTWGFRLTLGYCWGSGAMEVSGFNLTPDSSSIYVSAPGRPTRFANGAIIDPGVPSGLASYFAGWPTGFEGNNGLWTQATAMKASYSTRFGGIEGNYRTWSPVAFGCEGIIGCRFLGLQEDFDFATLDEVPRIDRPRTPLYGEGLYMATYQLRTRNHIIAPQLGFECTKQLCSFLSWGFGFKGALGADIYTVESQMVRGDGLVGAQARRRGSCFTQVYEGNTFLNLCCWSCGHLRLSYDFMGLVGVPEIVDQIDFNLANQLSTIRTGGSIFYHGPMIELFILF
jgi:hypothetical protein